MYQTVPTFMPNAGIVLNAPQEFLPVNVSVKSRNMEYFNGLLQARLGLTKLDAAILSGGAPINRQYSFRLSNGSIFYMFFTTKDVCYYDFSTAKYVYITPVYTTGTIAVSGTGVTGVGTAFLANVKIGDFLKVGAGNIDSNATWYKVTNVADNTHLTLATSAGTVGAGSAYVVRKTFTANSLQPWFCYPFVDNSLGDVLLATNGSDGPIYWDGIATTVSFIPTGGGNQLPANFVAKYIKVYKNRVIWAWCVEGGINNKKRIKWSGVANFQSYQAIDFIDLLDEDTEIRGLCIFDDFLMVGKEREWYVGRPDLTTFVFQFSKSSTAEGLKSQGSVIVRKDYVYYYGFDKKFHRWNILRDEILTEEIFLETQNFDQNLEQFIEGFDFYKKNQIRWFCPYVNNNGYNNYTVVFDYHDHKLNVWDCPNVTAQCSMGYYILVSDLYVDDPTWGEYYLDQQEGYWDDTTFVGNAPVFLYCGYDGIVRIADQGSTDDGSTINYLFRSTRNNFQMPEYVKRLYKQQFWFVVDPTTSITVRLLRNDSTSYDPVIKTIPLQSASADIVKKMITWDKEAQDFQIEISSTSFFAMLGWMNFIMRKRKINSNVY